MEGAPRAATAPEPRSWAELVSSYARNRDAPERREELHTAAGNRRQKIAGVNDRNPILGGGFKDQAREHARAQRDAQEEQRWSEKRLVRVSMGGSPNRRDPQPEA